MIEILLTIFFWGILITILGCILYLSALLFMFFFTVIYSLPYWWWQGNQPYSEKLETLSFFREIKNATYVYKCWLTGKKPTF